MKTEFNTAIFFITHFSKQSAKEDTSLSLCKSLRTPHKQGARKLGIVWTPHDNPISAEDIGLPSQLHTLLYIDCMLSSNQRVYSKSNA